MAAFFCSAAKIKVKFFNLEDFAKTESFFLCKKFVCEYFWENQNFKRRRSEWEENLQNAFSEFADK